MTISNEKVGSSKNGQNESAERGKLPESDSPLFLNIFNYFINLLKTTPSFLHFFRLVGVLVHFHFFI